MKENLFRAWDEKTKKMYYVEKEKDIVFALSPFGIIAIDIKNNKKLNHLTKFPIEVSHFYKWEMNIG